MINTTVVAAKSTIINNKKYYTLADINPWSVVCPPPPPTSNISLPADYGVNTKVSLWGVGDMKTDEGDITKLKIDCVVNAAKSDLSGGGGIDFQIWKAAGEKQMGEACKKLKGCNTGESKFTPGFKLPAKFVLHTVGPQNQDSRLLRRCYESCLDNMLENDMKSIAFCCIATGIYKFPNIEAAHIALSTVRKWLEANYQKVDRIIFCIWESMDLAIYKNLMTAVYFRDDTDFLINGNPSLHMPQQQHDDRKPKINSTATPRKTVVVGSCIIKKEKAEEFAESLASRTPVDEIGERKSSVCPVVVVKKEKTDAPPKSHHNGTKRKGKRVLTGCCIKKQKIDDKVPAKTAIQETYMLFANLPCPDSVEIHYDEIKSDISKHDHISKHDQDGFYYKQAKNVQISYSVDHEKRSIRLDNLLQRGFPAKESVIKLLTRSDLDKYVDDCPKCVEITGIKTDIVDDEEGDLTGPWKYKNSSLVTVSYTLLDDGIQSSIRLNDVHNRGFPFTSLKYYSFLHFKVLSSRMSKSVDEIKSDEISFMDCLQQVNVYFTNHPELVSNQ